MGHRVQVSPSRHQFEVQGKETILAAGMRDGLNLAHNCMNGSCGECIARLVEGKIQQKRHHDFILTDQQKQDGYFLTCCCQPETDLEIEMHELHDAQEIPFQEVQAKVAKLEQLQDQVMQLHLRTSRSMVLEFLAGQRVQICLPDGTCMEAGIASCPCDGLNLRFHIRQVDDEFSRRVFSQLKKGAKLLLKGPLGNFTLNESSQKPLIFITAETGFAQVQSIIDHAISIDPDREIDLYWLSAIPRGHYLSNYCRMWRDVLDNFRYLSIDLQPAGEESIESMLELMQQLQTNLLQSEVYAILPEEQLAVLKQSLIAAGLPEGQLLAEKM